MEGLLSKEVKRKARRKAKKNIENFLKELDKIGTKEEDLEEFAPKAYEGEVIKILDDYDSRRENVSIKWEELMAKAKTGAKDGYMKLGEEEKYKVCVKRRCEAEKILQKAHLGPQDTNSLKVELVNIITEIYDTYDLHNLGKEDELSS